MGNMFSGEPTLVWVTDSQLPDRHMVLISEFWYEDPQKKRWVAPANMKTNGASIPRALWTLIGSPFTGDYRRAALVHDQACVDARSGKGSRRAADRMFYHACRDGGCPVRDAIILYVGVRIGSIKSLVAAWGSASIDFRPRLANSAGDENMARDLCVCADQVLHDGETDDIDEIERRTDMAFSLKIGIAPDALALQK